MSLAVQLLRDSRFVSLWAIGATSSTVRWLEMLAVGIYVFDVTHSAFVTAFMTILRMLPLALFGIVAGAVVDKIGRRLALGVSLISMIATSATLWFLAHSQSIELWQIAVGAFLGGMFWITDFPVRRPIMGQVAGPNGIGTAMSLEALTNNGTRMLGPLIGGALVGTFGLDGTYLVSTVLYVLSLGLMWWFPRMENDRADSTTSVLRSMWQGIRHLYSNPTISGILMVTVVFNLWGFPFVSMIPVIGKQVLTLDAAAVGQLAAAEGAGALFGAFLVLFFARVAYYRYLYVAGVSIYLVMQVAFALSDSVWPSFLSLFIAGIGGAAFAAMQSTLVILCTPPEVQSRMMGVLSVCIGTGPIGFFHLGLLAEALGAPTAVMVIALEGMIGAALVVWAWPEVLRRQPELGAPVASKKVPRG